MLGDSGLVANADPTRVFRRFPWVQLVFCLACLSMTGWTWIRYSYAWEMTPERLLASAQTGELETLRDYFLCVRSESAMRVRDLVAVGGDPGITLVRLGAGEHVFALTQVPRRLLSARSAIQSTWSREKIDALRELQSEWFTVRDPTGRLDIEERRCIWLDATASRFTGASIAGIAVGAMGCFIFGLYLRAWLRERNALASEPQQDMIA